MPHGPSSITSKASFLVVNIVSVLASGEVSRLYSKFNRMLLPTRTWIDGRRRRRDPIPFDFESVRLPTARPQNRFPPRLMGCRVPVRLEPPTILATWRRRSASLSSSSEDDTALGFFLGRTGLDSEPDAAPAAGGGRGDGDGGRGILPFEGRPATGPSASFSDSSVSELSFITTSTLSGWFPAVMSGGAAGLTSKRAGGVAVRLRASVSTGPGCGAGEGDAGRTVRRTSLPRGRNAASEISGSPSDSWRSGSGASAIRGDGDPGSSGATGPEDGPARRSGWGACCKKPAGDRSTCLTPDAIGAEGHSWSIYIFRSGVEFFRELTYLAERVQHLRDTAEGEHGPRPRQGVADVCVNASTSGACHLVGCLRVCHVSTCELSSCTR
jgi:hypothetical protein